MPIKITPFHVWLRNFPKEDWVNIREDLYSSGLMPESADDWRLVRILSGSGAKLGAVKASDAPSVSEYEILWLDQCKRSANPDFYMKTTSGWAGKVRTVVRYYVSTDGYCSTLPEGLPTSGAPK
jgi:hypothetical protein